MRITQTFIKQDGKFSFDSEAYSDDNGKTWRWVSNDAFCPLDACEEYNIPCDKAAQKKARDTELAEFCAAYRAQQSAQPSDEERFEALAAHGPGVEMVDIISGRRFRT